MTVKECKESGSGGLREGEHASGRQMRMTADGQSRGHSEQGVCRKAQGHKVSASTWDTNHPWKWGAGNIVPRGQGSLGDTI